MHDGQMYAQGPQSSQTAYYNQQQVSTHTRSFGIIPLSLGTIYTWQRLWFMVTETELNQAKLLG